MARGFGVASRNPAADGDFRGKQAAEQADRRRNGVVNAGGNAAAEPPDFQALKDCRKFAGTTLRSCHGVFRSLIHAHSRAAKNFSDSTGQSTEWPINGVFLAHVPPKSGRHMFQHCWGKDEVPPCGF